MLSQLLNEAVWQMADYSYIKLYGVSTHPQETRAPTLGVQNLYLRLLHAQWSIHLSMTACMKLWDSQACWTHLQYVSVYMRWKRLSNLTWGRVCYMPILEFCHSICIAMSGDATGEVKRDPATVHKAVNVERDLACVCFIDFRANQGRWKGSVFPKVLVWM